MFKSKTIQLVSFRTTAAVLILAFLPLAQAQPPELSGAVTRVTISNEDPQKMWTPPIYGIVEVDVDDPEMPGIRRILIAAGSSGEAVGMDAVQAALILATCSTYPQGAVFMNLIPDGADFIMDLASVLRVDWDRPLTPFQRQAMANHRGYPLGDPFVGKIVGLDVAGDASTTGAFAQVTIERDDGSTFMAGLSDNGFLTAGQAQNILEVVTGSEFVRIDTVAGPSPQVPLDDIDTIRGGRPSFHSPQGGSSQKTIAGTVADITKQLENPILAGVAVHATIEMHENSGLRNVVLLNAPHAGLDPIDELQAEMVLSLAATYPSSLTLQGVFRDPGGVVIAHAGTTVYVDFNKNVLPLASLGGSISGRFKSVGIPCDSETWDLYGIIVIYDSVNKQDIYIELPAVNGLGGTAVGAEQARRILDLAAKSDFLSFENLVQLGGYPQEQTMYLDAWIEGVRGKSGSQYSRF